MTSRVGAIVGLQQPEGVAPSRHDVIGNAGHDGPQSPNPNVSNQIVPLAPFLQACNSTIAAPQLLIPKLRDPDPSAQLKRWLAHLKEDGVQWLATAPAAARNNELVMQSAVDIDPHALRWASAELLNQESLIHFAVQRDGLTLQYASSSLRDDPATVTMAMTSTPSALQFASKSLQDSELAEDAFIRDAGVYRWLGPNLRSMRRIALAAVRHDGDAFTHVPASLAGDKDICRVALISKPEVWNLVPAALQADLGFIKSVLSKSPSVLEFASDEVRGDPMLVTLAVQIDGLALRFASLALQSDPEIVRHALRRNGLALEHAGPQARSNPELVLLACESKTNALKFADPSLLVHLDFARQLVIQNGNTLEFLSEEHKANEELVRLALAQNGLLLEFASQQFKDREDIVRIALNEDGNALQFASERLRADMDTVTFAMESRKGALEYAAKSIKGDAEKMAALLYFYPNGLQYASDELRDNDALVGRIVRREAAAFEHASQRLRGDVELAKVAVFQDADVMEFVAAPANTNKEVAFWGATSPYREASQVKSLAYAPFFKDPEFTAWALSHNPVLAGPLIEQFPSLYDQAFFERVTKTDPLVIDYLPKEMVSAIVAKYPKTSASYDRLKENLKTLNIQHSNRFDTQTLEEVIKNRLNDGSTDPRPVVIVVAPKDDHNGAFRFDELSGFTANYRLMYYEANDENDFYAAVRESTKYKKADVLIIGGHGSSNLVSFGSPKNSELEVDDEPYELDVSDGPEMVGLSSLLKEGAQIVMNSCLTGRGSTDANNIANVLGLVFPNAEIIAPTSSINIVFEFDAEGNFTGPRYILGNGIDYRQPFETPNDRSGPTD